MYIKTTANGGAQGNFRVTVKDGDFDGTKYGFYTDIKDLTQTYLLRVVFNKGTDGFVTSLRSFITGGTYEFNPEAVGYTVNNCMVIGDSTIGYTVILIK